jgi:hypothetical protein
MTAPSLRIVAILPLAFAGALLCAGSAGAQATTRITEEPVVSQPPPFSTRGQTVVVPRTRIEIDEGGRKITSGDPLRRKQAKPEAEGEAEAEPEAAPDPGCRGSKILCGDPLRRKQKKREKAGE